MPFAVSATTRMGRNAVVSTKDTTWSANAANRSCDVIEPGVVAFRGA